MGDSSEITETTKFQEKNQTESVISTHLDTDNETNLDSYQTSLDNNGSTLPQVACSLAASTGNLLIGLVNAWSANALPAMSDDPDMEITTVSSSLIVGLMSLGAIIGCLACGQVLDWLGRRRTLLISSPIMMFGWGLIAIAPNIYVVYIGRFICGACGGFILPSVQIYSSETCEPRLRGRLGSLPPLFITLGVLFTYILTGAFHWRTSAFISSGISLILLVAMAFAPESPYWMLIKNRNAEAKQILIKIRGSKYDIDGELNEMEEKLLSVGRRAKYKELLEPRTRYPMAVSLLMMFAQQMTGAQLVMMYTGTILRAAESSIDTRLGTILTGVAQLLGFCVSLPLVDRFERKFLMAIPVALTGTSMIIIATYFLSIQVFEIAWPGWIPTVIMMLLVFQYCLGCRSIPWIVSSEMFNTSIRSRANSICVFFNRTLNFIVVQVFPFLSAGIGVYSVFYLHGIFCLINTIAILKFVPNTKGKSLEEIQAFFETKAKKKENIIPEIDTISNQENESERKCL